MNSNKNEGLSNIINQLKKFKGKPFYRRDIEEKNTILLQNVLDAMLRNNMIYFKKSENIRVYMWNSDFVNVDTKIIVDMLNNISNNKIEKHEKSYSRFIKDLKAIKLEKAKYEEKYKIFSSKYEDVLTELNADLML